MVEVDFMHLCDYAFQAEGGKACIIGIFDTISAYAFPATHALMTIAIHFRGGPHEQAPFAIELGRPNGDLLAGMDGQISMGAEGKGFADFKLSHITFPEAGRYTVKVSSGGRLLASQSLNLVTMAPVAKEAAHQAKVH